MRIGVATFPISEAGVVPLGHLINIVKCTSEKITLITGGAGLRWFKDDAALDVREVSFQASENNVRRIFEYLQTQLLMAQHIFETRKDVNAWLFFIGGPDQLIPICCSRLVRKKICILFAGSSVQTSSAKHGSFNRMAAAFLRVVQAITCTLADWLVVYSPRLIDQWELRPWSRKISIGHEHYIDTDQFSVTVPYEQRKEVIGFVGRLSPEKGIMTLIRACEPILKRDGSITTLLIIGDGELRPQIESYVRENGLMEKITLLGNIPHDALPSHINSMKILAIPSVTEGLPNVMLEAMACGTPIVATAVGSIPDIIKDKENGFIMTDPTVEVMSNTMMEVLSWKGLDRISSRSREYVEENFTFQRSRDTLNDILERAFGE